MKREEDAKGNFQESYLEIFKLLQWYQDLMLVQAAELLSVQAQGTVRQYVEREQNFQAMWDLFQENEGAWKKQDDIPPLEAAISKLMDKYNQKGGQPACPPVQDRILRSELCCLIFSKLGKKGLQVLLKEKK